jgi:hypothetical protein
MKLVTLNVYKIGIVNYIFKNHFMGVKFDWKMSKSRIEKNRRFVKISVTFLSFLSENGSIRIYRKTAPTKSTVLGPRPPPWRKVKFYRFLAFFHDFRAFNRAGKSVSKIGIYALPPPQNDHFIAFLYLGTRLFVFSAFLVWDVCCVLSLYSSFFGIGIVLCSRVFLFPIGMNSFSVVSLISSIHTFRKHSGADQSKKGPKALKQGIFGIVY